MSPPPLTVLVRMPNWLGDCIMAMPAIRFLSERLPNAAIHLAGRPQFQDLFLAQPGVAGFVEAPSSGAKSLVKSLISGSQSLQPDTVPQNFNLGILFTNSFSTAAWMWRTGPAIRVGYNLDCRRLLLTNPVPCGEVEKSWHFVNYYTWLVKVAASLPGKGKNAAGHVAKPNKQAFLAEHAGDTPSLAVDNLARQQARTLLAEHGITGRYAVFAPASAYGAVKDWPPDHYRRLAAMLREQSLPVALTGAAAQSGVCRAIADGQEGVVDVSGKTSMREFTGLLAEASLFVGGDSGGAHVAGALGIPTVVIFGITNPTRTRPRGLRIRCVGEGEARDVKLSTPEAREAARKALAAITPEAVHAAAMEMV